MSRNQQMKFKLCVLIATTISLLILLYVWGKDMMIFQTAISKKMMRTFSNDEYEEIDDGPGHTVSPIYTTKTKTILYWTKLWSSNNMDFGDGDIFASCPVWKCMATNNKSAKNVEDFDVIMFHALNVDANDLPQQRSPRQIYVFLDLEPQIFHPITKNKIYDNFYNWTMTYRRDSTLMRPYGVVRLRNTKQYVPPHIPAVWRDVSDAVIGNDTKEKIGGKTQLAAWFVSNCATSSKRESYVEALQQYIPVDVYGKCGNFECDRSNEVNCFEMVERDYFFYLAFENSLCPDYVTEKAFKFLQYDVVPVVYGAVDYSSILPPGSYINIRDFASPKELADYLLELSGDPELYGNYFKWKNYFTVEIRPERFTICEFCKRLHDADNQSPMIIDDIYGWWTSGKCLHNPTFEGVSEVRKPQFPIPRRI